MRLLLLQDALYLPSFGGGNRANRLLLESLARRGHECLAIARAHGRAIRFTDEASVIRALALRGIKATKPEPELLAYRHLDVDVLGIRALPAHTRRQRISMVLQAFRPDWILVSDDPDGSMLECALTAYPSRVVLLVHTHFHLPFGPQAPGVDARRTEFMRHARAILVVSRHSQDYLRRHGGLESTVLRFPLYGDPPFPRVARFEHGAVTQINPCPLKGLAIFLELAMAFPEVPFAAVPTWGAEPPVLAALHAVPNVTILEPVDEIGEIFAETRVLLAPTLVAETFGNVIVEAMLRGIPVLASDLGGAPEAKSGVPPLLPVRPAFRRNGEWVCPAQDSEPWRVALLELLGERAAYEACSIRSHAAAVELATSARAEPLERLLLERASE